jgi:hypothetical protein
VTYSGSVTRQIEGIRRQTVTVLGELIARADEFEPADPPPALGRFHQKLSGNAYEVLVVGEVKRGKSTFVNALIGWDILPTDVATSQVFNIPPSERPPYCVPYEDGSEREILSEDLPLYGSQVIAGVVPAPGILRCIEARDIKAEVNKEEPTIILLRKCIRGVSYLFGCKLCTQPLEKFRKILFRGIRSLRFPDMVIVDTSDVRS